MSKLKKIVLGLGGIALTVVGLSVLSNGEPVKYSPAWIEGLTDAEWASEREVYVSNIQIRSMMMPHEMRLDVLWICLTEF